MPIESGVFLSRQRSECGETFGCGAGTHNFIINTDLSLSACDISFENDRTEPLSIENIEEAWLTHPLFKKWRGQSSDKDFIEVHQHHCHLAYMKYGEDLFV